MAQGRVVPWGGWDEWASVRDGLLSGSSASESTAMKQVRPCMS